MFDELTKSGHLFSLTDIFLIITLNVTNLYVSGYCLYASKLAIVNLILALDMIDGGIKSPNGWKSTFLLFQMLFP